MWGGRACGVHCPLSTLVCCGVCFSVLCVLFCCAVLWVVEWRGVWEGVRSRCLSSSSLCLPLLFVFLFSLFSSSSSLCVGVRGSARAAMRARTLSPNTIASPLAAASLLFSSLFPAFLCLSFTSRLSVFGMAVGDSPCVAVLCWHDGDGESVSFVLVFLVVACSAFSSSPVAASAVAFGAEDSAVVREVGSS